MNAPAPGKDLRLWENFHATPGLSLIPRKILSRDQPVFTMGSCFAGEIRRALRKAGFTIFPDYTAVPFDPSSTVFDKIPQDDCIAHYDTFVIRQEFESAFGLWPDRDAGIWEVRERFINQKLSADVIFQEPSRKRIYSKSREELQALTDGVSAAIRTGIEQSNLLVITLGLTEVWRHNLTGRHICRPPETGLGGGAGLATFRQSTFSENYENVKATLDLLFAHYPDKQVLLTVSPVPLAMTYSKTDVATANTESKSILRAVAGQISREYGSNLLYFPSYEMATALPGPVFQPDGRHVLPAFAQRVVETFVRAYS
jgi:hypothetical protein